MSEKLQDLMFQFAVVIGMISGALMTYAMDTASALMGSGIWFLIILFRIWFCIRREDATNERSTSQDVDV